MLIQPGKKAKVTDTMISESGLELEVVLQFTLAKEDGRIIVSLAKNKKSSKLVGGKYRLKEDKIVSGAIER